MADSLDGDRFGQDGVSPAATAAVAELRACLGEAGLRGGAAVGALDPGWHPANLEAGLVASPQSTAEVAETVRICARHGLSIVPQGGRTGLVGGAISRPGQIVVSLARMNRIERLDPIERVAVVEAGVTLEALQIAAAAIGLEPGIDLAARGSATVGGMTSTNAGGIMAFRNGVMRHRILGLETVMADGAVYADLTRVVKNTAGYDLKHLFIGAEGTLGIVTRVVLKLDPLPRAMATALFGLPSLAAAQAIIRLALDTDTGHLRAAEALWRRYFNLTAGALGWSEPAIDLAQPLFLLIGLGGADESALQDALAQIFASAAERFPETTGIIAASSRQARDLWRLREDTDIIYRAYPGAPSFDVSVPLSEIDAYVGGLTEKLDAIGAGLAPFVFGHLADGNLHIVFNHAGAFPAPLAAAVEAVLYGGLRQRGGAFSAEHGIGSKRIHALSSTGDVTKLRSMRQIKAALDGAGLLNPGKIFAGR